MEKIIEEYVSSAQPISSQLLEEKYDLGICPATIRNEMQKLTEAGFIFQPHTSAGRVPTDKGYRLFVNELLEEDDLNEKESAFDNLDKKELNSTIQLIHFLTKSLAEGSSNLAFSYLFSEKVSWKEGWEKILQEPEFKETGIISDFTRFLDFFESSIEETEIGTEVNVYIGRENPFIDSNNFSMVVSRCSFPKKGEGVLAILGPKRMSYKKNICFLNNIIKSLADF